MTNESFYTKCNMLKKIFGSGDKESDQRVEEEVAKIEAGEITKVYPILKPGDWVGIKAGALKQTLIGTEEEPQLVIGFGYDAPSNFVFLMPKDLEGKDPNAVLGEAYRNLEEVESKFEMPEQLQGHVLTASGNDFSSEKILSISHMRKAHTLLHAEELLVSIPRRRCMMICSRAADEDIVKTFVGLHKHAWEDDSFGNAPIMNALFVVVGGKINGLIPM